MTIRQRRRPASLLVFLCGFALLFVATTMNAPLAAASQEPDDDAGETNSIEAETDNNEADNAETTEDESDYDSHMAVMFWLKNRAEHSENILFKKPWKNYNDDEDYQYQNGYFFADKSLRVLSGYNEDDKIEDENDSDEKNSRHPRIVATRDISKGDLLVGVPMTTFVYKQDNPTYKMLHPCDVASKLLNDRTYRYPSSGEDDTQGFPALVEFVRPFLDSILSLTTLPEDEIVGSSDRHLWSLKQLEFLKSMLGNELAPKPNTLVLWGEKGNVTKDGSNDGNELPLLCLHPNPQNLDNNKITDYFFDPTNPRAQESQRLFRAMVAIVVTRSWNNRMVPIYHWIARSDDDPNVVHSETKVNPRNMKPPFVSWDDPEEAPEVYELRAARDISRGEELVLPYHSVAQKFATKGYIGRTEEGEETHYRFWTQTLHDEFGPELLYANNKGEPYDAFLSWDYYPKTQTIRWITNSWDPDLEFKTLRPSQRNVLQAHYLRLRSMEEEVKGLLVTDPSNAGNRAIVEYHELWVESLGVLLANARPDRSVLASEGECLASSETSSCLAEADTTLAYDDLRERVNGDPINYINCIASHECSQKFKQTMYEENHTPYATLEWTRSYVGGGVISDHLGDIDEQAADNREQDTCLFLEGVLHSCLSFRPHVHETLIHYPASFLPKNGMKRVLYVGGGDLVLLHELLRYESIELVIGMELDQDVVRDSFRHYGIQPKFEDERVHWWFGDAAKSLSILTPEEYFGTFDMVLIDLVADIFDVLRVGEHSERLVDYMAKLVKPDGVLVRQEDWPIHNTVDFAKYTVDLNVFGMPHTCSQYFTMASNKIDFANHERVNHDLEGLVWYDPEVESHDHTKMWAEYRNNLEPPERICEGTGKGSTNVLPSNGRFLAIEAENLTMNLGELSLVQATVFKTLEDMGFSEIFRHDILVEKPESFSSMIFIFEEGYLMFRLFPEQKFASIDFQLWNDFSKQEITASTLVGVIGGDYTNDSTSTFSITTGGMFGISNTKNSSAPLIPSAWCVEDSNDDASDSDQARTLAGLEFVSEEILTTFVNEKKEGYIALLLCANDSSTCEARTNVNFGPNAEVITFHACPSLKNGNELSLKECEDKMRDAIKEALAKDTAQKIRAIVIDPEAPKEIGQVTNKLFISDSSSYNWLSHDFVVLAPSAPNADKDSRGYQSHWRYQLLDRFRTDLLEFSPVYHATLALRDVPSSSSEWTMGVLSAGNSRFYGLLIDSMDAMRRSTDTKFEEVILLETKTGAISHIPDYQPSKWATPSNYDIDPAKQQYSEQKAVGVQLVVQHELSPYDDGIDVDKGDKVLVFLEEENVWCTVSTVCDESESDKMRYSSQKIESLLIV